MHRKMCRDPPQRRAGCHVVLPVRRWYERLESTPFTKAARRALPVSVSVGFRRVPEGRRSALRLWGWGWHRVRSAMPPPSNGRPGCLPCPAPGSAAAPLRVPLISRRRRSLRLIEESSSRHRRSPTCSARQPTRTEHGEARRATVAGGSKPPPGVS